MKTIEPENVSQHRWLYLIALGSNVRHHCHGDPRGVLNAAVRELNSPETAVRAAAPIRSSAPLGPSKRRYANSAALIASTLAPPALLMRLKQIEQGFGRRAGQRWSARVLDLDIILWSGGRWRSSILTVPHPAFRHRRFVLAPALDLAPDWRDPVTGLSLRHLHTRLTRRAPLPRAPAW